MTICPWRTDISWRGALVLRIAMDSIAGKLFFGCRGKPAPNKHRMNPELAHFATRLRSLQTATSNAAVPCHPVELKFDSLALELFTLQFQSNSAYRKICEARKLTPPVVAHWTEIPAVPTSAFKELDFTSLAPVKRTAVFHSSGTTAQPPSRHFHSAESLAVYEASLWENFKFQISNFKSRHATAGASDESAIGNWQLAILTPPPAAAPHSSLVHMFETVRRRTGGASVPASLSPFFGTVENGGAWTLDFRAALAALESAIGNRQSAMLLGTAFSFVHLLDFMLERNLRLKLPAGSRVLETGGYKNRSRVLPKAELHALITERLGVPVENIICEYGMSELSSQAYDSEIHPPSSIRQPRIFHFPPWARAQIISPETGREVATGETGLIRIFDLANVFSVAAIQTEDLGIRRGDGFELVGRAPLAEPRGCSLMSV